MTKIIADFACGLILSVCALIPIEITNLVDNNLKSRFCVFLQKGNYCFNTMVLAYKIWKIQPFGQACLIHCKLGEFVGLQMNLLVKTIKIGTRDELFASHKLTIMNQT